MLLQRCLQLVVQEAHLGWLSLTCSRMHKTELLESACQQKVRDFQCSKLMYGAVQACVQL